jgi:hypothetical protein
MKCDERVQLLRARDQATLALATGIERLLNGSAVDGSSIIYEIRRRAAERAEAKLGQARVAYDSHVDGHRCEATMDLSPQLPAQLTDGVLRR